MHVANSAPVTTVTQLQHRQDVAGRFKFDARGKVSLNFWLNSGRRFTAGWNETAAGPRRGNVNLYLKHLFLAVQPVKGIEVQYGGFDFLRGQHTEITTYNNDGYLTGQRLILRHPQELFFDEVATTDLFSEVTEAAGLGAKIPAYGESGNTGFIWHGAAAADFNNDGDTDIFIATVSQQVLFRNNVGSANNFLRVALTGTSTGKDAFGAVVRVKTTAGIETKIKAGGSGFVSQNDPRLLFGLGKDKQAEYVEVTWPNGQQQRFANVAANTSIAVTEGNDKFAVSKESKANLPDPLTKEDQLFATLKLKKGLPFPALMVEQLDGTKAPLASLQTKGHKTLINLWATWCIPCLKEMPELDKLYPQFQANKISLIGLSIDTDEDGKKGFQLVNDFLTKRKVSYPIAVIGEAGGRQIYAVEDPAVPLSILLDEQGHIEKVISGWSKQTALEFEKLTKKQQ
jgi:thiol-disulfide isomerase/thioredoxin